MTHAGIQIFHADCREVLPAWLYGCVDLVLTDPPYGIPAGSAFWRKGGTSIEDWKEETHNVQVNGWHKTAAVLLVPGGYLVEFCRGHFDGLFGTYQAHIDAGLTPWCRFLLVKSAPAPTPRPKFMNGYEDSIVSFKGEKRRWFGGGATPDRWIGQTPNALGEAEHPTEKPAEAMVMLIRALCPEDGLVLDPFMGSGTTAPRSQRLRPSRHRHRNRREVLRDSS